MFDCKVCHEKEKRISDLKAQIASLQKLVFPQAIAPSAVLPVIDTDANAEDQEGVQLSLPSWEQANLEANAILTGTY